MSTAPDSSEKKTILFENGQSAEVLYVRKPLQAADILKVLNISQAKASIIVGGSTGAFSAQLKNRLIDLLSRGVAQAALDPEAILIDEGMNTGVSEILGQGVVDRGRKTKLVGIFPQSKSTQPEESLIVDATTLEANHTHFVVNEQHQPGWQARMMCELAAAVSENKDWILTVLVGGDLQGTALDLALETVRRGWRLVVIEGSGTLADEIIKIKKQILAVEKRTGRLWKLLRPIYGSNPLERLRDTNPRLYEIISDGRIMIVGKDFEATQLRNLIKGVFLSSRKTILWTAWQRFAEYDQNSIRHRISWHRLRRAPLYLTALSTLLVLIHSTTDLNPQALNEGNELSIWSNVYAGLMGGLGSFIRTRSWLDLPLRIIIILLPIVVATILSAETRSKPGSKYLVLRGAAEAVKRGIYSFRVLKGRVSDKDNPAGLPPHDEKGLANHLGNISKVLTDSDVNEAAFIPYGGPIPPNMFGTEAYDDGFSALDPETYVRVRVGDQLRFYTLKTNQYEKDIRRLRRWMLIFGAIGTFLAAVGMQYWLPLTAAIVSMVTAFLEYQQLEQLLTKYNLTKSNLETIQANWLAQPEEDRTKPENIQNLVREVEATLESENQGWVQYIKQAQGSEKGKEKTAPPS